MQRRATKEGFGYHVVPSIKNTPINGGIVATFKLTKFKVHLNGALFYIASQMPSSRTKYLARRAVAVGGFHDYCKVRRSNIN